MRIGFTFDRVADWAGAGLDAEQLAEFDEDATISAIVAHLVRRGHEVEEIGRARALIARLAVGARWDIVFNICEGLHGPGREALVPALLESFLIPCVFSDSAVLALALHKSNTKRVLRDLGLPTADFWVLDRANPLPDPVYPVFLKPVAEGTGKGIGPTSLCRSPREVEVEAARLIARFRQPVLAERFLPGREFTVGIVGTGDAAKVIGVMEIDGPGAYGFALKKDYSEVHYRLVEDAEGMAAADVALRAWRALGCRDAGRIDLRSDSDGKPNFLEVNPLPGLHPIDSDLVGIARRAGHDHGWLLDRIMESACARAGLRW